MRKILVAITTLAMALVISLSSLFGCKLITTNNERDMKQVVATVQIDPSAPKENIYKKDILVDYYNYLYQMYLSEQEISSSSGEIFSALIDESINDIVMIQYAMNYFAESGKFGAVETENRWKVETYLSEEEKIDAKYDAYREFDYYISAYETNNGGDKTGDTLSETVRTVPTKAQKELSGETPKKIDKEKKIEYIEKYSRKINKNSVDFDNDKYNAFVKALNQIKSNNLLGDYQNNDIETIEYFKNIEENYQKDILLENFQNDFEAKYRLGYTNGQGEEIPPYVDYSDLQVKYNELYAEQSGYSIEEFENALTNISAESPILKGQAGYGMVYHVLLKADETTATKLEELKTGYGTSAYKNATYSADRAELFSSITAKDQRSSWIKSHYDFDGEFFTGNYVSCESAPLRFYGSTTHINNADANEDDYVAKYRVNSVEELSLVEFLDLVNGYLFNSSADIDVNGAIDSQTFVASQVNADYDNRIKELIFAFSQDDGDTALNTYKGYAIKPTPDADETEEWVLEFAEEARSLVKNGGQNTFKVVATDYGYHVMFYSENFANVNYETLEAYLTSEYGIVNKENEYLITQGFDAQTMEIQDFIQTWGEQDYQKYWEAEYNSIMLNWADVEDTTNFLYLLQYDLSVNYINNEYLNLKQDILQNILYDSNKVIKYEKVYKDLIGE